MEQIQKECVAFHLILTYLVNQVEHQICYKITTHNQSAGSKETRITAVSHGWK